jgi:hypothetical protein
LEIAKELDRLSAKLDDVDEMISSTMAADPQVRSLLSVQLICGCQLSLLPLRKGIILQHLLETIKPPKQMQKTLNKFLFSCQ